MNKNGNFKQKQTTKEFQHRASLLLNEFNSLLNKVNLDPVLDTFKSNEMLHEFYMKRIFEIIKEFLANEKERYIETLVSENQHFRDIIEAQKGDILQLKDQIDEVRSTANSNQEKYMAFEKELKLKDKNIKDLNKFIDDLNREIAEMNFKQGKFEKEYKSFKDINYNMAEENELLKTKIKILEEELEKQEGVFDYCKKLEEESKIKEDHLDFFKENFNKMKSRHDEISIIVDNTIRENEYLKKEIGDRNLSIEELISKIESLKIEYQVKEEDFRRLQEENAKLQNSIDNVLKVKIKALKNKLKEKVEILSQKEKEFEEYKSEKEKLLSKIFSKK